MTNSTARTNNYLQQLIIQRHNLTLIELCDRVNDEQRHAIDQHIQQKVAAAVHFSGILETKTRKLSETLKCIEYAQDSSKKLSEKEMPLFKIDKEDIPFFKRRAAKYEKEVKDLTELARVAKKELAEAERLLENNRSQAHQFSYGLRTSLDEVEL